jgi:dienelactone hydrolase
MKRAFRILLFAATLTSFNQACANDVGDIDKSLLPHRVVIKSGNGTVISGYLYRPERADPAPAVLMLHGCSGMLTSKYRRLKSREKAWREIFLAAGYVVLLLDSFTARGYKTICRISLSKRPIEPHRERPHDAYGALRWLQSHSFVDPEKIALGGWSNGAMTMLWTVYSNAPQRPETLPYDFRVAFGFYPGCITLRKKAKDYTTAIPTLLQLGADDNWTWPKPCQSLVEEANARGKATMTVDLYEGAVHSFDHPRSKRREIAVSNNRRVQVGTHRKARKQAINQILAYLKRGFSN